MGESSDGTGWHFLFCSLATDEDCRQNAIDVSDNGFALVEGKCMDPVKRPESAVTLEGVAVSTSASQAQCQGVVRSEKMHSTHFPSVSQSRSTPVRQVSRRVRLSLTVPSKWHRHCTTPRHILVIRFHRKGINLTQVLSILACTRTYLLVSPTGFPG